MRHFTLFYSRTLILLEWNCTRRNRNVIISSHSFVFFSTLNFYFSFNTVAVTWNISSLASQYVPCRQSFIFRLRNDAHHWYLLLYFSPARQWNFHQFETFIRRSLTPAHKFRYTSSQDDKPSCSRCCFCGGWKRKRHLILFMEIRSIALGEGNLLFLVKKFSCDAFQHFSGFNRLYVMTRISWIWGHRNGLRNFILVISVSGSSTKPNKRS